MDDAQLDAQLLVLAPQLPGEYLSDEKQLQQTVKRFKKGLMRELKNMKR